MPACWEARRVKKPKMVSEIRAQKFSVKKLELIESDYPNSKTPLLYRCTECGYVGRLRFNDLSNGAGCRQCGIRRRTSLRKLDFEAFKNDMHERGIEVRAHEYVNSGQNLTALHGCGTNVESDRKRPSECRYRLPELRPQKRGRKLAHKTEHVSRELAKLGMVLLSAYESSQKPIRVRFKACGHEVERTYNQLSRWTKCGLCAPNARATAEDYLATARMFGGRVLKIASSVRGKSLWRCSLGKHEFERSLESIRRLKTFCTICTRAVRRNAMSRSRREAVPEDFPKQTSPRV